MILVTNAAELLDSVAAAQLWNIFHSMRLHLHH